MMATKTTVFLFLLMSAIAVDSKKSQKPRGMSAHPQEDAAVNDAGSHGCFACSEVESMLRELKGSLDSLIEKKISDVKASPSCLPQSCSHLKNLDPSATNGNYTVDPDGEGGLEPFTVFCDMSDKNGVGVTVISHDSESRTLVQGYEAEGSYSRDINYEGASLSQLASLTGVSSHCEQFIKYECYHSVLLGWGGYGWWVSRNSSKMTYWGGAKPGSGKCACGMTNSCADPNQDCNCDKNDRAWREDSGLLTDKSHLPVTQLRFGDTGTSSNNEEAYHTLGKLKCYGIA